MIGIDHEFDDARARGFGGHRRPTATATSPGPTRARPR